jgi:dTDP-glucose pyrophosphorylase
MSDLWIVIPAAGESRRFKEAGYDTPKPLLVLKPVVNIVPEFQISRKMIEHVVNELPLQLSPHLICAGIPLQYLNQDLLDVRTPNIKYIGLEKTTGQAESVLKLTEHLPVEDSVLVLDCDMILRDHDIVRLVEMLSIYDVSIAVTKTFDPNASRVDQIPYPTRFVEKEPISEYGIVGARAFKNIGLLNKALKRTLERCKTVNQEPYLSMAINHYPGVKFAHLITDYVDLGTPERIKEAGWEIIS